MRVVHAGQRDPLAADVSSARRFVRSAQPRSACAARRSRHGSSRSLADGVRLDEVPVRGLGYRRVEVVVAEDERARQVEQVAEGRRPPPAPPRGGDSVSPVLITRSGRRSASARHPADLALLARGDVQVGEVQEPDRPAARRAAPGRSPGAGRTAAARPRSTRAGRRRRVRRRRRAPPASAAGHRRSAGQPPPVPGTQWSGPGWTGAGRAAGGHGQRDVVPGRALSFGFWSTTVLAAAPVLSYQDHLDLEALGA